MRYYVACFNGASDKFLLTSDPRRRHLNAYKHGGGSLPIYLTGIASQAIAKSEQQLDI